MLNKIFFTLLLILVYFGISSSVFAQAEDTVSKDTTAQTTSKSETVKDVTVPAGTKFKIIFSTQLATNRNVEGSTFSAALDAELKVDTIIVSPQGSQVIGKIVESKSGQGIGDARLSIQVTEIMINKKLTPVVTDPIVVKGERRRGAEAEISAGSVKEVTLKQALKIN